MALDAASKLSLLYCKWGYDCSLNQEKSMREKGICVLLVQTGQQQQRPAPSSLMDTTISLYLQRHLLVSCGPCISRDSPHPKKQWANSRGCFTSPWSGTHTSDARRQTSICLLDIGGTVLPKDVSEQKAGYFGPCSKAEWMIGPKLPVYFQ